MNNDTPVIVTPLTMLSSERGDDPVPADIMKQKQEIVDLIVTKTNLETRNDSTAWCLFMGLGGDVMINAFSSNFMIDGEPNKDVVSP
jgi:hypothetical protein